MAKPKHRKFNGDKFVDTFGDNTQLLRDFVRIFIPDSFPDEESFSLSEFKEYLAEVAQNEPNLIEHLYRAYDFSKDEYGHEALCKVIRDKGLVVDDSLPVECLAIWLHNNNQDAFNFAYDRMNFCHLDKVTMYRVDPPQDFEPDEANLAEFSAQLREQFLVDKGSANVLVRQYLENESLNIIVYHERRTQAHLIFKGNENAVGPLMLRPAKQDFVSFNTKTGELHVDASYAKEKEVLRKAFAGKFLQDEEKFETDWIPFDAKGFRS